ncbi:cysteine proteinase inhibitor 10-like [Panicum virgatum]|uniref:cysteine proteinase inhibitor 10-like n=1 Tax=Panicum virgatum TaxID=38727 RepID=UPI0019D6046A|nr:cysteine proteinase inhibitor 10-like [Panicum virgatum]
MERKKKGKPEPEKLGCDMISEELQAHVDKEVHDHFKPKKPEPKIPLDPTANKFFLAMMCQSKKKQPLSDYDSSITKSWEKKTPCCSPSSVADTAADALAAAVGGRRDITDVGANKEVQSLGRFAVAEHNRRLRRSGGVATSSGPVTVLLSFGAVAAAQEQVVSGVAYYLKVIARDDRGDRPFDAVVVVKAWLKSRELVSFTPSPK